MKINIKKGQATIFIIVAIVLVAAVVIYFVLRNGTGSKGIPSELQPVYDYYTQCIEKETRNAVNIIETQGGRINVGDYVPGSDFMPFSNQLNFLGYGVPYWYYISGNGVIRESIPSRSEMEREIGDYISENIGNCDFEQFYEQGFEIKSGQAGVSVRIEDTQVRVDVSSRIEVKKGESSAVKTEHLIVFDSKLGKFYKKALEIYDKEKREAFLENYSVDVLRLYAPVDGVELSCAPKIWKTQEVFKDIENGLEANIANIKLGGNYYTLSDEKKKYFVLDLESDESVNFLYSNNWPTKIEVDGDGVDDSLMQAESVGTQEGLGVMGFCYVPYHFVYDIAFPVMVQIYDNEEMFQFPVSVVIDNNVPRKTTLTESPDYLSDETQDLCEFRTSDLEVNLYDINLNKVEGHVSYECFNQKCDLGDTKGGTLNAEAPACVNGYLNVKAEGYANKRELLSSNVESFKDVILDREREVNLELFSSGKEVTSNAIIVFEKNDGKTTTAVLPDIKEVILSEGGYDIRVYVYSNSSVTLPASSETKCVDVSSGGLLGLFGGTEEKCFDINIPATKVEYALSGGGETSTYILDSDLEGGRVKISVSDFGKPNSLEDLQYNFERFSDEGVNIEFQ